MPLGWRRVTPVVKEKEYAQLKRQNVYVTAEMGRREIEPNIVYWDWAEYEVACRDVDNGSDSFGWRRERRSRKQIKFWLLPKAIPEAAYMRLLLALQSADWDDCQRGASGQKRGMRKLRVGQFKPGTKLTVGFFPQKPGYAKGSGWTNIRSAPTMEQPELMSALRPTLRFMDDSIREELPEYHDFALEMAMRAWRPETDNEDNYDRVPRPPEGLTSRWSPSRDLRDMSDEEINRDYENYRSRAIPDPVGIIQNLDPWQCTYTLFGTVFSTVELNQTIVFKAHEDGNNVLGTLVGITAVGSFVGGRLVFPRYGFSAELGPRDLLICDNNHELHGNLGPVVGERFSVVAFLHKSVCDRPDHTEAANEPAVWDCHAGKKYPADAEYVGCRVRDRKGNVLREGTIFGNGTNPLVSHKGAVHSEREFRARAIEKLKDSAFRAETEKLRGKHLLCWCVQDGANRAEFCHARVWLDLLNGPERQWESESSATDKRREFEWGYYQPNFLSKDEADALFQMAKDQPRFRPVIRRSGHPLRRCASTCWSVRDRNDDSVGMVPLSEAPPEVLSLQQKLSALAGKEVNYFSLQAYENQRDHIDWHQHREDKCRDARVFIISLGERRTFGVDKLCPECLLCDNCNRRRCHPNAPPCSNSTKCKAAKKHRKTCSVRNETKILLLPEHGSLIALTSEANDWYEHAVLDDKEAKGLRISINTKCIPPEDATEGYVPRELRRVGGFAQEKPGS